VLNFIPKKKAKEKLTLAWGKLYIRELDLAIIRIEGMSNNRLRPFAQVKFFGKVAKVLGKVSDSHFSFTINYKDGTDGYPHVEAINCTQDFTSNFLFEKGKHKIHITSTLFAVGPDTNPPKEQKTAKTDNLLDIVQQMEYRPDFWKNNSIVKRTKVDEEIIKSFENANAFGTFKPE
jgi:hypothetical protein